MNIEELKKLKEQLIKERNQNYVVVNNLEKIEEYEKKESLSEILENENTDKFVEECEILIKESLIHLINEGIDVDKIGITSIMGYLMKMDYVKKLIKQVEAGGEHFSKFDLSELKENISLKYVPLSFSFANFETFSNGEDLIEYRGHFGKEIGERTVSGIVDFDKFISIMENLGYTLRFLDEAECHSMEDYISDTLKNQYETYIVVEADLTKTQKETNGFRRK